MSALILGVATFAATLLGFPGLFIGAVLDWVQLNHALHDGLEGVGLVLLAICLVLAVCPQPRLEVA